MRDDTKKAIEELGEIRTWVGNEWALSHGRSKVHRMLNQLRSHLDARLAALRAEDPADALPESLRDPHAVLADTGAKQRLRDRVANMTPEMRESLAKAADDLVRDEMSDREQPPTDAEIEAWAADARSDRCDELAIFRVDESEIAAAVALMRRARAVPSGAVHPAIQRVIDCAAEVSVITDAEERAAIEAARRAVPSSLVERAKEWVEELNAFDVWRPLGESGHMTRGEQIIRDLAKEANDG